ncbi:MAG: Threonylcarbamoyladenosine tRNA methylthiotransferase MtaB [Firmicutes bacterium ADurb.Bin080]|jgi:threonylcarbamoyladenosine tRNA methylthiotransferase MtaB|nr:tRNA (N(6)-L-threonylcarbamoyladenosine(37)-C(2))-methylthiotransferase MtaB [Clostridiales bacterium]OQC12710.1 MAG: Threonylcarbamoyladenosine tRNA methylthiotransferase MtaB [Firmicutes bacterium ADurb.Bin080]
MNKIISVFNIGCKVNQYECDCIQSAVEKMGAETSNELTFADIYVVNTCSVTAEAERKSRQIISRIRSINPEADIIITGCAAEKNPKFYEDKGTLIVSGVLNKNQLIENIKNIIQDKPMLFNERKDSKKSYNYMPYENISSYAMLNKTRALVKIQDGCDNFCSYCTIPLLRGKSRSRSISSIVSELEQLRGLTQEVVLTGINLSSYGKDINDNLVNLISIMKDMPFRFRIGSFYLDGIDESLMVALSKLNNFCPHFHLSLQSCSDSVLYDMGRRYNSKTIEEKIRFIKSFYPVSSITADIIVGYPTETESTFQETYDNIKSFGLSSINVFPFSRRENTKAYYLKPLPNDILKERKMKTIELSNVLEKVFLKKMLSEKQKVIFEGKEQNGLFSGYSEYYIRIYSECKKNSATIKPTGLFQDGLKGVEE